MAILTNDPKNYHKMSKPFESEEKANEALQGFYKKVEEARKEFKIADILITVQDSFTYPDGKVGQFLQHAQYGYQLNGVPMAAYTYGKLKEKESEMVSKLIAGNK